MNCDQLIFQDQLFDHLRSMHGLLSWLLFFGTHDVLILFLNSWNYLHKSDDNWVTWYCRNQQFSQMWLDFASEKTYPTPCYQVQSTLNHVPKSIASIREEKFDTAIELLLLIRIPSLCKTFTSRTLSKMIQFWICKDQNDLLHTAQHAEPLGGHI